MSEWMNYAVLAVPCKGPASAPHHSLLHPLHPDRHPSGGGLLSVLVPIRSPVSDCDILPGEVIVVRIFGLGLPVLPSFKWQTVLHLTYYLWFLFHLPLLDSFYLKVQ